MLPDGPKAVKHEKFKEREDDIHMFNRLLLRKMLFHKIIEYLMNDRAI